MNNDTKIIPRGGPSRPAVLAPRQLVLAIAAVSCVTGPLTAPTAIAQEARILEEVIVTARRKEENAQQVPIAITALGEDDLREKNILQLEDLRSHVPSLTVSVGGSTTNSPLISLRGQRPSEILITLDPAVPLYFSEVVLSPTQGTNLSMYDLENIQVLKGPQGTLFGRNSTGGAVLFTPRRPGDELGGYVELRGGDYGQLGIEGAIDIPMGDAAALRLAGRMFERDGYQDNVADNDLRGDERFWDEESQAFRATLRLSPGDSFENISIFDTSENDMAARAPTPIAFNPDGSGGCQICPVTNSFFNSGPNEGLIDDALARQASRDWNEIETDVNAKEKVENTFFANITTWEINNNFTVKNIFGYRELKFSNHNDTDGTGLPMFGTQTEGTQSTIGVTTPSSAPQSTVDTDQYSNELQLLGMAFDNRLDWIVGGYWFNMDGSQTSPTQILPIVLQDSPKGDADNTAYSIFGEATYDLSDSFALTLGLRQTWDEREVTVSNTRRGSCLVQDPDNPGTVLPDDQCNRKEDEDFDEPTYRVVLTWTPTVTSMAYGSVSTGYRTGGFNMRGTTDLELTPFDEETVTNYEIGYKADWLFDSGMTLRTNFAVYYQDYQDIQRTQAIVASDGTFGTTTVNAADAEISGFEADIWFSPLAGLDFSVAYSYIDAEYKKWRVLDPATEEFVDQSDYRWSWVPENSLAATVRWQLPLSESLGTVALGVNYYYQDEMAADLPPDRYDIPGADNDALNASRDVDDYQTWDLRADWLSVMQSNFDLAVWMQNADDEAYGTGGLNVLDSLGWAARVYGPPRTWGASLRYRF